MTQKLISADSHVNPPPTIWREYLPAAFEDLADAALEDAGRGGDAVLARAGVLLGNVEDAGRVAVAEDLARLVAAPRPLRQAVTAARPWARRRDRRRYDAVYERSRRGRS